MKINIRQKAIPLILRLFLFLILIYILQFVCFGGQSYDCTHQTPLLWKIVKLAEHLTTLFGITLVFSYVIMYGLDIDFILKYLHSGIEKLQEGKREETDKKRLWKEGDVYITTINEEKSKEDSPLEEIKTAIHAVQKRKRNISILGAFIICGILVYSFLSCIEEAFFKPYPLIYNVTHSEELSSLFSTSRLVIMCITLIVAMVFGLLLDPKKE